jgi:3-hydroxyisobutyrate dehydrogenase-like beta-hydroxyacid dehydrogenase
MMRVGFVGLGDQGGPMARRILSAVAARERRTASSS